MLAAFTVGIGAVPVTAFAVQESSADAADVKEINVTWNKGDANDLSIPIGLPSADVSLTEAGSALKSILLKSQVSVKDGKLQIDSSLLDTLKNGLHEFTLRWEDQTLKLNLNITGENEEKTLKAVSSTSFVWDRNSREGILVQTDALSGEVTLRSGKKLIASGSFTPSLTLKDGEIQIGSDILGKLQDGDNELTVETKDGKLNVNVYVTDRAKAAATEVPDGDIHIIPAKKTDKLSLTWDRKDKSAKIVLSHEDGNEVILSDGETILADNSISGLVTIENGEVKLKADLLEKLQDGSNTLTLELKDKKLTLDIFVTNEDDTNSPLVPFTNETTITWDRNSDRPVLIAANTNAKEFVLRSGKKILSDSRFSAELTYEDGRIKISPSLLKTLSNGKNELTLEMQDGNIRLTVDVVGDPSDKSKGLTADTTEFTWDKSELTGISVHTNSDSSTVAVLKNGKTLATNKDIGVSIFLGRVGITSRYLRKLDVGKNHLVLSFEDGEIGINVTVTDKKNIDTVIQTDQSDFTWKRGSKSGIVIHTNSQSETLSVRRNGRLLSDSGSDEMEIKNGTVTLKPAYLELLRDGDNTLTLKFEDGSAEIGVKVISGNHVLPANESGASQSETHHSNFSSFDGLPNTGSAAAVSGISAAALSGAAIALIAVRKRRRADKADVTDTTHSRSDD